MFKTMLVPVSGARIEDAAFGTAVHLARLFNAHIDFLYVRPEAVTAAATYGGALIPGMTEQLQAAADRQHGDAMQAYLSACEGQQIPTDIVGPAVGKVTARWHREIGHVAECVAHYGYSSDLLVIGQSFDSDVLADPILQGALLNSGRPVLFARSRLPSFETIAIAWKGTRETARALDAALPFLERAKRVVIIHVAEKGAADQIGTDRLATNLQRHGCLVETCLIQADSTEIGNALLTQTYHTGAGLLVMGAYSRSRVRELLFGGVTSVALESSELPILMAH